MPTHIALFRGINVTGKNVLPMKELSAIMEDCGASGVRTYIQSGNVVFSCPRTQVKTLASRIASAVAEARGFTPSVIIVDERELARAVERNPYPKAARDPKSLHLFFLASVPKSPDLDGLEAVRAKSESFTLDGRCFYLHAPEGFGRSKLAQRVERRLGVEATARNWRTVTTLLDLARVKA